MDKTYHAEVILDSISPSGARLTTQVWTYWRMIHSEVMTYRMFCRNSSSSRALPPKALQRQVLHNPAGPVYWGSTIGAVRMQAGSELTGWRLWLVKGSFYNLRYVALFVAWLCAWLGLHRQVCNRVLEPWQWITVIITASPQAWENCYRQRVHPAAQPEFQLIASLGLRAFLDSSPVRRVHHLPFVYRTETDIASVEMAYEVSTARCARVSYETHYGVRDLTRDVQLYHDLHEADPPHTSPKEHPATAHADPYYRSGPLIGWVQWRERTDKYWIAWDGSVGVNYPPLTDSPDDDSALYQARLPGRTLVHA